MKVARWEYTADDCEGSYEDDASEDLALLRLERNVLESEAHSPLLKPYLADDYGTFFAEDYTWPTVAGYV